MKKMVETTENQLPETVTLLRVDYDALTKQVDSLRKDNEFMQGQIKWLMEKVVLANKEKYGSSSEKTNAEQLEQFNLFNEAELIADTASEDVPDDDGQASNESATETKKKRKPKESTIKSMPVGIPVETEITELSPEEQVCPKCGSELKVIGTEVVREEIVLRPATVVVKQIVRTAYGCDNCEKNGIEATIIKSTVPEPVIKGGNASPESIAQIATQKFVMGSPLKRQEDDFKRNNIRLSRQTMSNWLIMSSQRWLKPIYDILHKFLIQQSVLMADETTLQVLKEPGKTPQSKSYMWLYRTSGDAKMPIVLFEYQPDRKASRPAEFLKGFKGYLNVDGYSGYNSLIDKGVILVACWSHCRRKWEDSLKCMNTQERIGSLQAIGENYCNKLFKIEREIADKSFDEKYKIRQELAVPVLNKFNTWLKSLHPAPNSHLGIAVTYTLNQWDKLNNYLLDGRLEVTNNRSERSIKPFVQDRKVFLFSNTPSGANSSAAIFSIIETAKENGLNPYEYLKYIFKNAPNMNLETIPDAVLNLLPNNPDVLAVCSVPSAGSVTDC